MDEILFEEYNFSALSRSSDNSSALKKTSQTINPKHIQVPEQMNCNGNIPTNWKTFREAYEDYLIATGLDKKDKVIEAATLKSLVGTECKKILKRLQLSEEEMKDPKTMLDKLGDHFVPAFSHASFVAYH
ncbi:hypothetical protein QZH41_001295 [Actinostola sp. cb2023]|nr:hypothetical protein QZH41_001295 [Actinostola sp. cb2023]